MSSCRRLVCISLNSTLEKFFPREYQHARLHTESIIAISACNDKSAIQLLSITIQQFPTDFQLQTNTTVQQQLSAVEAAVEQLQTERQLNKEDLSRLVQHTAEIKSVFEQSESG